ncbi:hypothetical protein [Morganella morganii]|uniref:hypothetical protein n=1 Tax=Morganella morganii TaxID=582 RepID=UPI001F12B52C|nr:hypothetical protein [Morganella morganii]
MAIPNTVANGMISGVIGEISHNGPTRVTAAVISSADETKTSSAVPTHTKMIPLNPCRLAVMVRLPGS